MKLYEIFCGIRSGILIGILIVLIFMLTSCGDDKKVTGNTGEIQIESIRVESIKIEEIR